MKFVVDTNVLVAALRSRRGASNALLLRVLGGEATWLCSVPLFLEYEDVLMRAEFVLDTGHTRSALAVFLTDIAAIIRPVELNFLWRPQLVDPNDEMVLEAAVNGQADAIITFNTRDFSPEAQRFGVDLLTPAEALKRISE
ncbi:MAG: putative toxin-antitoxin system toxin component, PIN family [Geminicoccaceae bacterium]|nr:putative toxin-antitoxin system toxin component, PIN family [Geminicoccaceae bacterium]